MPRAVVIRGITSPSDFRSVVECICGKSNPLGLRLLRSKFKEYFEEHFLTLVKDKLLLALELQSCLGRPLVILQREILPKSKRKKYHLVFNGRHCQPSPRRRTYYRDYCLLFDSDGCLIKFSKHLSKFPDIHVLRKMARHQKPLWQLLRLEEEEADPTDYRSTVAFLQHHKLEEKTFIALSVGQRSRKEVKVSWHEPVTCKHLYNVIAFTTATYGLGFCLGPEKVVAKQIPPPPPPPKTTFESNQDMFQANKSAAVCVKLTGLNEALHLGLMTEVEFSETSQKLGSCPGSLWIDYDDADNARYITYVDFQRRHCLEVNQRDPRSSWFRIFDFVFGCLQNHRETKTQILQDVLDRLQWMTPNEQTSSPWNNCKTSIQRYIKQMLVLVYSRSDDKVLHCIKNHFAHYVHQRRKFARRQSVRMKSSPKNDIITLSMPDLWIVNVGQYFGGCAILQECNLPLPLLHASRKRLASHERHTKATLAARGIFMAEEILRVWKSFGDEFLNLFQFDIHSIGYTSLATLSFKSIWTKYASEAGSLHHGLEKIKPAVETLLREKCQGGFSWSCQDTLDAGQPLHNDDSSDSVAKTIAEFDIIGSYGFAASHMSTPTGFQYSFVDNGNSSLISVDKIARHKTYEFKSVFFTIWSISQSETIRYVYSNFHLLGYLRIGPYPIDLAVITESQIHLFQFDGDFVHGCPQGCADLKGYVGGKSRLGVEMEAAKRDAFITEWIECIHKVKNKFITYSVKNNCHSENYTRSDLKNIYESNPILREFIDAYPDWQMVSSVNLIHCKPTQTFIALIKGFVPPEQGDTAKPIFLKDGGKWRMASDTGDHLLLVTKDYLRFLVNNHNFNITHVFFACFYKICPTLPNLFSQLLIERSKAKTVVRGQLLKNVINYTCGYFGFNELKNMSRVTSHRLIPRLPFKFDITRTEVTAVDGACSLFVSKVRQKEVKPPCKSSNTALPLFICVVDYGKLKIAQLLSFINKFTIEGSVRHLYSNVDNVILAMSADSLDECVKPDLREEYLDYKKHFFDDQLPGHFSTKWTFGNLDEWKFASARVQNYAIITNDAKKNVHKISAMKNMSSEASYNFSCKLLNRQEVIISQQRRVNKLLNMDKTERTFTFKNSHENVK